MAVTGSGRGGEAAMDNPFRYGDIATGDRFVGREKELAELQMDMRSGQNVVIVSPRRYGKTSLVIEAMDRVREQGVLTAYVDMFRTPTKSILADHLASAIYRGLLAPVEKAREKALELFHRLPIRPTIVLGPDGQPSMEFSTWTGEQGRSAEKTLERLLEMPGELARDRNRRVVMVFDEFQQVVEIDPHLPALMRSVFQAQPEVCHLFLGSRRHLMRKVFTDENEPMYRLAKPMALGPIDPGEFSYYLHDRFAATGVMVEDEAIQELFSISGGHPYVTLALAHVTWNLAVTEQLPVTERLVGQALGRLLDAEDARYTEVWSRLSPGQRLVASTIAVGTSSGLLSERVRRIYRLGPASSVQNSISRLVEVDIIESDHQGGYRMVDPLLSAWLSRTVSPYSQQIPPGTEPSR